MTKDTTTKHSQQRIPAAKNNVLTTSLVILALLSTSCQANAAFVTTTPGSINRNVVVASGIGKLKNGGATPPSSHVPSLSPMILPRRSKHTLQLYSQMDNQKVDESMKEEDKFVTLLSETKLREATNYLTTHPTMTLTKTLFKTIFDAIETRTAEAEENSINNREVTATNLEYPITSPARTEMANMYSALVDLDHLKVFGAAGNKKRGFVYPASGSKVITPTLLENALGMTMLSLTPKPTNNLLFAGVALALLEGFVSLYTGIDFNFLIFTTVFLAVMDRFLVNGAVFETIMRTLMPEYSKKILRHEAGHFLCAYLLGCPVEGCVLSSWAALQDTRFGGRSTSVSAGTSFFDPELSDQMNGLKPLSRDSIDRYSVIVMGGIAAEAMNFGRADGGAGDEMALIQFLSSISPKGGGAAAWDAERIRNQARWGAMQAVLLLRHYSECYDALVDALERGGDLGDCIYAIEEAAKKSGKTPLVEPLGYVLDKGLYGEWTSSKPVSLQEGETKVITDGTSSSSVLNIDSKEKGDGNDDLASSEAFLKEYRKMMEDKLTDIDKRLEDIENNGMR
mmetsp:Transcript_35415/g.52861  ORF Transcript_35415/g.52861 Transcript_35415/m.52861 type:complete len:567 (-) Transcript_35415:327-2027(-)